MGAIKRTTTAPREGGLRSPLPARDFHITNAQTDRQTHTNTHTHNRLTAFVRDNRGRPVPEKNTHPLTPILIIGHPLSSSSIYSDPWHPLRSFYVLDNPLGQPLSRPCLVFLLVLDPELHTPYFSSPNHHHHTQRTDRQPLKSRYLAVVSVAWSGLDVRLARIGSRYRSVSHHRRILIQPAIARSCVSCERTFMLPRFHDTPSLAL